MEYDRCEAPILLDKNDCGICLCNVVRILGFKKKKVEGKDNEK